MVLIPTLLQIITIVQNRVNLDIENHHTHLMDTLYSQ